MSLERIVRPFQTGEISPPKPVPVAEANSTQNNVILTPGKNGSVRTLSGSYNITITYYFIKKPREKRQA